MGVLVALVVLWRVLRFLAHTQLDKWWFAATTTAPVWSRQFNAKLFLTVGATALAAGIIGTTVFLVLRTGNRIIGEPGRGLRWYHGRMGPAHRWVLIGVGAALVWRIARAAGEVWPQWILYRNGQGLSTPVPGTGGDLGDYLFDLPFEMTVSSFVRGLLIAAAVIALFGHTMSGALRWTKKFRSRRLATAHLAVLLGLLVIAQVVDYLVVRPRTLALNRSGGFVGAGYTELTVVKPALVVVSLFAIAAFAALMYSVVSRRWRLPAAAVGVWVAVHLIALVVLPAGVERFLVRPAVGSRQLPALARNLAATRVAYGLDRAEVVDEMVDDGAAAAPSATAEQALAGTPLFDPERMAGALQALQGTTGTRVTDVDLDRYVLDGTPVPVLVGNRQPDRNGLPESGWVQERMVYTHGDGLVLAPANVANADGRPDFATGLARLEYDPHTYFGEGLDGWWAVVGTKRVQQDGATYRGNGGVSVDTVWRRAVAALALGDSKMVLSAEFTGESQLLYRRGLRDRLNSLAPFLAWDSDPYPAVVDGRVLWIVDGYSTSATYPYSQYYGASGLPARSDVGATTLNYLRLAARAVVDASSGETHLYRATAPGQDPMLDAWSRGFPGLFEPADQLPGGVRGHLRYPADLFVAQTSLLGQYHVTEAEDLFNGSRRWSVTGAAATTLEDPSSGITKPVFTFTAGPDGQPVWSQIRSFSPGAAAGSGSARDELTAIAVASNDQPDRIVIRDLTSASDRQLASPRVAQAAIAADPEIARAMTLLNANGSKVQFGPMTPVVVDGGLVWVRSVIVTGSGSAVAPRLNMVLAVSRGVVGVGDSVPEAIRAARSAP